jgi:hypothetical protein
MPPIRRTLYFCNVVSIVSAPCPQFRVSGGWMDRAEATLKATAKLPQWYRPGQGGNPRGRINIRARAAELVTTLSADFPDLGVTDQIIAAMMIARSESISSVRHADAAIRLSSESRRLLANAASSCAAA